MNSDDNPYTMYLVTEIVEEGEHLSKEFIRQILKAPMLK